MYSEFFVAWAHCKGAFLPPTNLENFLGSLIMRIREPFTQINQARQDLYKFNAPQRSHTM